VCGGLQRETGRRQRWWRQALTVFFVLGSLSAAQSADARRQKIQPPKLTKFHNAVLPPDTALIDVDVRLLITIKKDGTVAGVEFAESAPEPWATAAQTASLQFKFRPARKKGKAIAVKVPFIYRFKGITRRGSIVSQRYSRRQIEPIPGYQLQGRLVEKGTRTPLAGVSVELVHRRTKQRWERATDGTGSYRFNGLPPGSLELRVITGEHRNVVKFVRAKPLSAGGATVPLVYMDPVGVRRYHTVVNDRRKPDTATVIHLTKDEITQVPGTFGDPTRVVATLPGVSRSPFGLGYYLVRGASFQNTWFFIDGHPAFYLYHLFAGPGVIHPELVGNLLFYPGGAPVQYGRFGAGAVVLETANPPSDRWHLDVEIDLLKSSALFSTPFDSGKGQVTASFRRSYYDLLLPLFQTEGNEFSLSYTDYQLRVTYDFSRRLSARFLVLGTEDRVGQSGNPGSDEGESSISDLALGFHRIMGALDFRITPKLTLSNSLMWEYDHTSTYRSSEDDATVKVGITAGVTQLLSTLTWKLDPKFKALVGVDTMLVMVDADMQIPSLPPLGDPRPPDFAPVIFDYKVDDSYLSVAPYFSLDWEFIDGVRVIPGVRVSVDRMAEQTRTTIDPRLSARWKVAPGWTVKSQLGIAHQPPELFQTAEPFGDPATPHIRSRQASLGFEWEPGRGWEISVEGFYQHLDNLVRPQVEFESGKEEDESVTQALWKSDMEGRGYGLELMVRKRAGNWFHGWLSYTLARAERLRPPKGWELFELDQTHVLNLAWTFKLGADWSLGSRFTLTSGNPYFPIAGSRFDADRNRYQPIFSQKRRRLGVFHKLDIRLDKRWRFDTWMIEAYLDIQNIYNASNPETRSYSYDFSVQRDGVGIPILPTLGVRMVF